MMILCNHTKKKVLLLTMVAFACYILVMNREAVKQTRTRLSIEERDMALSMATFQQEATTQSRSNSACDSATDEIQEEVQIRVNDFCLHEKQKMMPQFLDRQMLVDDKARTLFCYVPKAGCTTLKVALFYKQGALPKDILQSTGHPNEEHLEGAINRLSFMVKSEAEKAHIMTSYFKFIMYRNPMERLISAYRSKIQRYPLYGLSNNEPERNWLRQRIYKYNYPEVFNEWITAGGKVAVNISFPEFINFWLYDNGTQYDEHFQTIYELCQPCRVNYSYYGNFNTFRKDAAILLEKIGGNTSHLLGPDKWPEGRTADVASKYYSLIPDFKKRQIIDLLAKDLSFYYTVFPSEKDRHKAIMGIDYDVPPS